MMRNTAITAVTVLCLVFGLQGISYSDIQAEKQRLYLQKHVDKVRIEKPREYQEMVDKAGTIENCLSCHEDEFKKKEDPK
ncbi:MAG: hypothetical protein ISR97_04060 [Nitrospira sp.]|nr:hypothetical protein [Nitrospira sp.]